MRSLLFALMPNGFLPVLLVFLGLALILGLVSRKNAFSFIKIIIIFALLSPFIASLFKSLPMWIVILIVVAVILSAAKGVLNLLFGKEATGEFLGHILYDLFMLPFRLIGNVCRRR